MSCHLKFVKILFDKFFMSMLTFLSHGLIGSSGADHLVTENDDGKPNENGTLKDDFPIGFWSCLESDK